MTYSFLYWKSNKMNIVSALMQDFDIAREATEVAYNSDGSAMREQENYMQSIQYSIDRFKAAFQELSVEFIGSDFLKGFIDAGTKVVEVITAIIDKFGALGTIITGVALTKGISTLVKNFDQTKQSVPGFRYSRWVYHGREYAIMAA